MEEEEERKTRLPDIPDSMLKIDVSQLNLGSLKRKRDDCPAENCSQAPAGQDPTDENSLNVGHDNTQNASHENTEYPKNSVCGSDVSEASAKYSIENDCFEPPMKKVRNSYPAPGRKKILLHIIKQKLVRKAMITHATAARKRWQLENEPRRKNIKPHKLMTEKCLPNRTELDATRTKVLKSSESENTPKNRIQSPSDDIDKSGVEPKAKNAHEGSPPCNETDLENASVHSISSEDIAIDWQPDSQANDKAFVNFVNLDSNDSDTTAPGLNMVQLQSTTESVEPEDHYGEDTCKQVKESESLAIANVGRQTEQILTQSKSLKCTNGHIETGHNITSNKNTTCDNKSSVVSKDNMESNSSQSEEKTNETNERDTKDEKTQDVCRHSKADNNRDSNCETGYENSNMDYQAVPSDLDLIYELENSQKISAHNQVKANTMDNIVQSNTPKENLPSVSETPSENVSNEMATTSTIANTLGSSHTTIDSKTIEKEKLSQIIDSEQKGMLEGSKSNTHATQGSMDVNSNDIQCSTETSTCTSERKLPAGEQNSKNQEVIESDMEPQTTVNDDGEDDIVLEEAVADEADYISVTDSVDDDLLVDEHVTVAFHGRNDSHDLFLSHCLVGAMFRENHPNMRWEDEELEQISVAVKPIVKLMKSSRDYTKKTIPDCELKSSEVNRGPGIVDKQPIKNYLLSKKGCEIYMQCSQGLFHLRIGPALKGSRKRQDAFEQAIHQLKTDLNTVYLLTVGNFTQLIWMSMREADRFDTYEFSKYNNPLAAQFVTAEVIYKFVIEGSKASTFRLQPITVTKVEELYKDICCSVVTSTGTMAGPIDLTKLLSSSAVYRLPVVLIPVQDLPPPKPKSRRASVISTTSKGLEEKLTAAIPDNEPVSTLNSDASHGEVSCSIEAADSTSNSKDSINKEATTNASNTSSALITASMESVNDAARNDATADQESVAMDVAIDSTAGETVAMETNITPSSNVLNGAQYVDSQSTNQATVGEGNSSRVTSTQNNGSQSDGPETETNVENNSKSAIKEETVCENGRNDSQVTQGVGKTAEHEGDNSEKSIDCGVEISESSKDEDGKTNRIGELSEQTVEVGEANSSEKIANDTKEKGDSAETDRSVLSADNVEKTTNQPEEGVVEAKSDGNEGDGDAGKDDVSDDDTVSYHSEDLIINEQTGDLELRSDKDGGDQDLPDTSVMTDDVDDTGDVAQETQNFGLVLQTMDPASAADFFFNSENAGTVTGHSSTTDTETQGCGPDGSESMVILDSEDENEGVKDDDTDDLVIVGSELVDPKEKSDKTTKVCSLVRCMLTTFYSHSPMQVGYGRKGAESDSNPVSIDLTSDDEDDTKTKINDVEPQEKNGRPTPRAKSAVERFLDETSNVNLLKLRVFGGNQELIVNRRSTIAGLPSIFCMSLMGQIQTWFMGQATTGLKEEVTTLESLKSSLQTFFTRDNYSEVLVYVNKKHCYCVSAISNGRFTLMNPENMVNASDGAKDEDPKGNVVMFFSSLSSLCFYLYQVISDIPKETRRMLQLRGLHVTMMTDITKACFGRDGEFLTEELTRMLKQAGKNVGVVRHMVKGHPVFRRLQYAVTAPVANFSLAGCLAGLIYHSKQHPIHRWTGCPENVLHYSDVIYAMMIGMSKNVHQAIRAVSSIIHVCIDGTGLFIGLLNRMSWMVGNGPADLYKKLSQNTLPCLLTMGGYHLVVDWDKQRNRFSILYPRSMKDLESDGLSFHYMVCEHTNDLYDFLCTPFCVSNSGYIQSVRVNYCYHGNAGMLHMSAIEGINNSAHNVDKVKPCFSWMGNRINTDVTSGQLLHMSSNENSVAETVCLSQPIAPAPVPQQQQQQQQQLQRKPTQVFHLPNANHIPSREEKLNSMISSSFEVCLATLLHYQKFRTMDFVQEYSSTTDHELTRHISAFKRMFGNQQLETKLRSRKVEGVAIWIDNMFLRVGFRLPGSSGSVTRAQILSAGHSPTKAPAVLKALTNIAYPCLLNLEALTTTGSVLRTHILVVRNAVSGVFHVLYPQSFISKQPSVTVLPVVEMTYSTIGRLCVAIFQRIPATAITVNYWLWGLDVDYNKRSCTFCHYAGPAHYHLLPEETLPPRYILPKNNEISRETSRVQHKQHYAVQHQLRGRQQQPQRQQVQQQPRQQQQTVRHQSPVRYQSPARPQVPSSHNSPQPIGRVLGQVTVTPPSSKIPNTSAPLVNVNKRPISLDNVSSTVTDLVTHLLQKSGLATRAENTDTTTIVDEDDDDDVCITRMEPARGLSAQRQQQRTQVVYPSTQRNTQRNGPQSRQINTTNRPQFITNRQQQQVQAPRQTLNAQQGYNVQHAIPSPRRGVGRNTVTRAPTPDRNGGVYPVALIPAAAVRRPPTAQGGMVTGNYTGVAQPRNQTLSVGNNVSNAGLNNVRNMNQNIVTGVSTPGNNRNNQQRPTMPSTQALVSYAVSTAQNIHSRGVAQNQHYSQPFPQPPPLMPAPGLLNSGYSARNTGTSTDYINIAPLEIEPDASLDEQLYQNNTLLSDESSNMMPQDSDYQIDDNTMHPTYSGDAEFQIGDATSLQSANTGPIEIIPEDADFT